MNYVIQTKIKGGNYWVREHKESHFELNGLKDNATVYKTRVQAHRVLPIINPLFKRNTFIIQEIGYKP